MKRIILLLLLIHFSDISVGQEIDTYPVTFSHIALSVKDVNNSAKFYKDLFGLQEITDRNRMDGVIWLSLGGGNELHLITTQEFNNAPNINTHFALTVHDFDSFIKLLESREVKLFNYPSGEEGGVIIRPGGIRKVYIKDLDGNWVEVISDNK
jgi:catechol 2,3-dioxygenase-like lactoylglutathione lyase family enzyme